MKKYYTLFHVLSGYRVGKYDDWETADAARFLFDDWRLFCVEEMIEGE